MKPIFNRSRSDKNRRGFSLTEFAIVLAVSLIIVSGIWAFVTPAWERYRQEKAVTDTITTINNVRSFYLGQLGIPRLAPATLTVNLAAAGVIPGSMIRRPPGNCTNPGGAGLANLCTDGPWATSNANGTFRVCWSTATGGCQNGVATGTFSQDFGINFLNLRTESCIKLASRLTGADMPPGLVSINLNGVDSPVIPPLASFANANCAIAGDNNSVTFIYRLRPPL